MKKIIILSFLIPFFVYSSEMTNSKESYKEGANFGKNIKPNLSDIKNFDTSKFIEGGINPNPEQANYYKGVKGNSDNSLMNNGMSEFNNSEFKQPILDSMNNKPALTKDDELISDSLYMQKNVVKDQYGNFCIPTILQLENPIYKQKSCSQDIDYGYCKLKPIIKWKEDVPVEVEFTETKRLFPTEPDKLDKTEYLKKFKNGVTVNKSTSPVKFLFTPTHNGRFVNATIKYEHSPMVVMIYDYYGNTNHKYIISRPTDIRYGYENFQFNVFGKRINHKYRLPKKIKSGGFEISLAGNINDDLNMEIEGEQQLTMERIDFDYPHFRSVYPITYYAFKSDFFNAKVEKLEIGRTNILRKLFITYTLIIKERRQFPVIEWERECDFNFEDSPKTNTYNLISTSKGKLIKKECLINNTEKVYTDELGRQHTINFPCFEYEETYEQPIVPNPACEILNNDKSCSQDKKVCNIYDEHNNCTQFSLDYSCAVYKKEGKQCGELFYTNCETEECNEKHQNKNFGDVASKLQTVTEAAQDINEDPYNIKIFTGKTLKCRKAKTGYNNCCKDSGWGQDVGLAGCNNQEKELGGAKKKGLAIAVGEYCSKEVLGVCLEKKRSYCVFNSKLAKIVQQQGRRDQLKIGWGSKKHPNCRGLTLEEFEQINFDIMNFQEFYNDLNNQIDIPSEEAIKNRIHR